MTVKSPGGGGVSTGSQGSIVLAYTDNSGTPGNTTINTPSGRAAIAAAGTACTVTSSCTTATSKVHVCLESADATLTFIKQVVPGAGSFVVTGNAGATGNCKFSFLVFN
jgi:hypothetical protein